ncbi:RINT-1/TIP-20 [Spinellus fusiger]|nr:RINT-1/TIP-20 [Spinellus fusiger]
MLSAYRSKALTLVQTDPEACIKPYFQLTQLQTYLQQQAQTSNSYQHLVRYVGASQAQLKEELNTIITSNFKAALDSLSWPTPIKSPYSAEIRAKLEIFQKTFCHLFLWHRSCVVQDEVIMPAPIRIMLEALSLRFRFHFEGSKPTNRVDKPEWYLAHIKNTIDSHLAFLVTTVQPTVDKLVDTSVNLSVKDYFIYGLLQDVHRKLNNTMGLVLEQSSWLSHTVHEALEFDKSLQDEFAYVPPGSSLLGVADIILQKTEWFNAWFNVEKQFSQARYDEILLDRKAFEIEEGNEDVDPEEVILGEEEIRGVKGTRSATKLLSLLESITETYHLVPSLTHRFKFCAQLQLPLLNYYYQRIASALDSFEARSYIRSVPVPGALPDSVTGAITASETGGTLAALKRLCRWWSSTRTIVEGLRDWSEDDFFLHMQSQASQNPTLVQPVLTELRREDMTFSFSEFTSLNKPFFSEALEAFELLSHRIQKLLVNVITKEWANSARPYTKRDTWWQSSTESILHEISPELYLPLQGFRLSCHLLYTTLPLSNYLTIYKAISDEIGEWYWRSIITQNQFSKHGSLQLQVDLEYGLWKSGKQWVKQPENYMKRLKEASQLLTISFDTNESSDKDIARCELPYDIFMKALTIPEQRSIVQIELDRLGIEVLTFAQIRDVLRRRNDTLHNWN